MSRELIINASLPETRIALTEDGKIQELLIERASDRGIVGNIYKGRVTRVLPGMQAAFVDIGLDKAAFLYVDDVYHHPQEEDVNEEDEDGDEEGLSADEGSEEGDDESWEATASDEELEDDLEEEIEEELGRGEGGVTEELLMMTGNEDIEMSSEGDSEHYAESGGEFDASEDATGESQSSDDEENDDEDGDGQDPDRTPFSMGPPPEDDEESRTVSPENDRGDYDDSPEDTVGNRSESRSKQPDSGDEHGNRQDKEDSTGVVDTKAIGETSADGDDDRDGRDKNYQSRDRGDRGDRGRGRRRGRNRGRGRRNPRRPNEGGGSSANLPGRFQSNLNEGGDLESDRSLLAFHEETQHVSNQEWSDETMRSQQNPGRNRRRPGRRQEFRQKRSNDRRVRPRGSKHGRRSVDIQDILKEGQEVIVQVAKDPIASKGARLTCHVSLPGRHLVCMPTIDHVGVSRRIENDQERRELRNFVEKIRNQKMGFIVRTASGGKDPEHWIQQDVEYLEHLWGEIMENASKKSAPAIIYEDLHPVIRAVRDWVSEDVSKIVVDSRYFYNSVSEFVKRFMPFINDRVEMYHGDLPIFDAYGISTELHRALERRVWLKSGGYIVIDQAEALVAIDINTGRFVGKKNLEDTILKTNLEAVEEIAYQLRLRNCGGIIIIDLIDMEKEENRLRVLKALESALRQDRARPTIVRMTEIGLIEMTRKRTRDTMVRALCQSCNYCEGKGFIKSKATVAYEVLREIEREGVAKDIRKILVQACPEVIDLIAIEHNETLEGLEKKLKKQIYLQAIADFHPEQFEVMGDRMNMERKSITLKPPRNQKSHMRSGGGKRRGNQNRNNHRNSKRSGQYDRNDRNDRNDRSDRNDRNDRSDRNDRNRYADSPGPRLNGSHKEPPSDIVVGGNNQHGNQMPPDSDEEDRLAFLRAQAAQDAALAAGSDPGRTLMGASGDANGTKKKMSSRGPRGNNRSKTRSSRGGRGRSSRSGRGGGGGRSRSSRSRSSSSME